MAMKSNETLFQEADTTDYSCQLSIQSLMDVLETQLKTLLYLVYFGYGRKKCIFFKVSNINPGETLHEISAMSLK